MLVRVLLWISLSVFTVLSGCTIAYREQHRTALLRIYHNSQDHAVEFDAAWAEMALRSLAEEFGLELSEIAPIYVYFDCDRESPRASRFNRFTKSIVLKVGQAELPRLYVHEVTHLLLDQIDGSPPYWVDQGLAEYMESRSRRAALPGQTELLPPWLERRGEVLWQMGMAQEEDLARVHLSRQAIDEGLGWAAPFIHYLLRQRWAGRPFPVQVRRLTELSDADLDQIAPDFLEFCRNYNPVVELLTEYLNAPRPHRLAILRELKGRFRREAARILDQLLSFEMDPELRQAISSEKNSP